MMLVVIGVTLVCVSESDCRGMGLPYVWAHVHYLCICQWLITPTSFQIGVKDDNSCFDLYLQSIIIS